MENFTESCLISSKIRLSTDFAETDNSDFDQLDLLNRETFNAQNFKACMFPWSSVHINYDGNLFPCIATSMGNVKTQSLNDIIAGEKFTRFRKEIKKCLVEACNRCGWLRPAD